MARIKLLDKIAPEEGTYTIKIIFKDEELNLVTPVSINWWLTDMNGDPINDRSEVAATPANPLYLTMSGPDLQMNVIKEDFDFRVVTLRGTYNSDRGSNLPFTLALMFKLQNQLVIAKQLYVSSIDHIFTGEYLVCSAPA